MLIDTQVAARGAVSSDCATCSEIGLEMLKKGGSAVDAAIATVVCMGVVHPHQSGIGGSVVIISCQFYPSASSGSTTNKKTIRIIQNNFRIL